MLFFYVEHWLLIRVDNSTENWRCMKRVFNMRYIRLADIKILYFEYIFQTTISVEGSCCLFEVGSVVWFIKLLMPICTETLVRFMFSEEQTCIWEDGFSKGISSLKA